MKSRAFEVVVAAVIFGVAVVGFLKLAVWVVG